MHTLNIWKIGWKPWYICNWIDNFLHFFTCIKYSWERITKGYCAYDLLDLGDYWQDLMGASLHDFAKTTDSYPGAPTKWTTYDDWVSYLQKISLTLSTAFEDNKLYQNPYQEEFDLLNKKYPQQFKELDNGAYELIIPPYTIEEQQLRQQWRDAENLRFIQFEAQRSIAIQSLNENWTHLMQ